MYNRHTHFYIYISIYLYAYTCAPSWGGEGICTYPHICIYVYMYTYFHAMYMCVMGHGALLLLTLLIFLLTFFSPLYRTLVIPSLQGFLPFMDFVSVSSS